MIQFFDKFMNRLEDLDFIEVAWNRKWREPGDFSVHLAAKDWNKHVKFVKNTGRPETGIVQKTVYEVTSQGALVTISGFFAEKALSAIPILNSENLNVTSYATTSIEAIFNTYAGGYAPEDYRYVPRDLPALIGGVAFDENIDWLNAVSYFFEEGTNGAQVMYDVCGLFDCSFYAKTLHTSYSGWEQHHKDWIEHIGEPQYFYKIFPVKGKDLRNKVVFGAGFENVSKIEYVYDDSGAYPVIEAHQTMDEIGFKREEKIKTDTGEYKGRIREFYIDETNRPRDLAICPRKVIEGNVSGIELKVANESIIREQLRNQCKLEMLNNWKQETINVDVLQNTFYYLKDYDLGDTCTIVLDDIEQMFTAQIMEIKEVWRKNAVEIQLVFGTPFKQKYVALNL